MREAARRLNVASSAVSRQITHLEDALGMALFERDGRRLKLAPAGEILFRHTRRLEAPLKAAVLELDMLRGLKTGTVRLATVESIGVSFLPQIICAFGRRYPRLHLDVSVVSAAEVIDRLVDERVDLGFGFVATLPRQIELALRRDVRIGAVMRADHPLAAAARLTLAVCLSGPIAIAKPEISIRTVIEPFLQHSALALPPLVEVDSIRMLVELALTGRYVSIRPRSALTTRSKAVPSSSRSSRTPAAGQPFSADGAQRRQPAIRRRGLPRPCPAVFRDCRPARRHLSGS